MVDKTLYISGQIGFDPSTMEIVQVTIVFRLYQQNGLITYYDESLNIINFFCNFKLVKLNCFEIDSPNVS